MDRHDEPRGDEVDRLRGALGVEVALAERRAPAGDRQEGDVDFAEVGHLVEQVGVAGEVHRAADAVEDEADRSACTRLCGPRPSGCTAGTTSTTTEPNRRVSPALRSRTRRSRGGGGTPPTPAGTTAVSTSASGASRRSDGRWR